MELELDGVIIFEFWVSVVNVTEKIIRTDVWMSTWFYEKSLLWCKKEVSCGLVDVVRE